MSLRAILVKHGASPDDPIPLSLGPIVVADVYGTSYDALLERAKRGDCPAKPLRIGKFWRWPTAAVLRSLGVDPAEGMAAA